MDSNSAANSIPPMVACICRIQLRIDRQASDHTFASRSREVHERAPAVQGICSAFNKAAPLEIIELPQPARHGERGRHARVRDSHPAPLGLSDEEVKQKRPRWVREHSAGEKPSPSSPKFNFRFRIFDGQPERRVSLRRGGRARRSSILRLIRALFPAVRSVLSYHDLPRLFWRAISDAPLQAALETQYFGPTMHQISLVSLSVGLQA